MCQLQTVRFEIKTVTLTADSKSTSVESDRRQTLNLSALTPYPDYSLALYHSSSVPILSYPTQYNVS